MLKGLIGSASIVGSLKEGLTASMQRTRLTSHRIANAGTPAGGFDAALRGAAGAGRVDLETEMVALADEQLRYEAMSKLLQKVYSQVRTSVRER